MLTRDSAALVQEAMAPGALALLAIIATLGAPRASAACTNQDAGSYNWRGICLFIEQQPDPRSECAIAIDSGMPPDLCCICGSSLGASLGDLQTALPPLCKVRTCER